MDPANRQTQGGKTNATAKEFQRRPLLRSEPKHEDKLKASAWVRWRVVFVIFSSLLAGLAFALGHHFMNNHLNGKPVTTVSVSQSWIFRFGTAFAFLVKVAFAFSVAASYVQYQWFKFHRQTFRVDEIDSLTSVLEDVLQFFHVRVFTRQPILLLIAIVAWTIPFAAVVTPGSLTVAPAKSISIVQSNVPQPAYNASYFGNITYESNYVYAAPMIYKLAYNTAAAGQPVALSSEHQNETYSLTFDGPAVKCFSAAAPLIRNATLEYNSASTGGVVYQYVSWVPGQERSVYVLGGPNSPSFDNTLDIRDPADVATIFVMTSTGDWNNTTQYKLSDNVTDYAMVLNVTECQLYNATYEVDFVFQYPNQTRTVSISKWLNPVKPPTTYLGFHYESSDATLSTWLSYLCMMQAFGKLLVGYSTTNQYDSGTSFSIYSSWQIMDIDWSKGPAVQAGLESLFQNLTLSMLSQDDFVKAKSETDQVPITVTTYPVTYKYAAWELLVPYGVALLFTLLCAVIGCYAFVLNHASYHNVFSSFLRATSGHEVHALLGSDSNGADPLPADLAKIKISMGTATGKRSHN